MCSELRRNPLQEPAETENKNKNEDDEDLPDWLQEFGENLVDEQPSNRSKKNGDKRAVAMLKSTRQLGCVFQDIEPPKSSSIFAEVKPIRCVLFTKSRHTSY